MADKQAAHRRFFILRSWDLTILDLATRIIQSLDLSDNFDFINKRTWCQLSDNFCGEMEQSSFRPGVGLSPNLHYHWGNDGNRKARYVWEKQPGSMQSLHYY
jgi:hypothetical protein